ncbi:MAG: hypothetical protein ACM32O_14720 [Clostridia bacterium]
MQKSRFSLPLLLLFMLALVAAGCGQTVPVKEALKAASQQQTTLNSYSFSGTMALRIDSQSPELNNDPESKMVIDALKNTKISYRGTTSLDPQQTEIILDASIPMQDVSMNFTMPIVMNQEKLWVKIPALPMLPESNDLSGKYVEIDYKELSQLSGQPINASTNTKAQRELANKILDIFFKDMGDSYFADVKKEEAGLPQDVAAERVVKFQLTNESVMPFIKTLLGSTLPQIIDATAQSEVAKEMNMTAEEAAQAKTELQTALKELETNQDLQKTVQVKKADMLFALEKDNGISYQKTDVDLVITPPEETGSVNFGFTLDQKINNKNAAPKWEIGIPKAEEVVKFMEAMGKMMAY